MTLIRHLCKVKKCAEHALSATQTESAVIGSKYLADNCYVFYTYSQVVLGVANVHVDAVLL